MHTAAMAAAMASALVRSPLVLTTEVPDDL